MEKPEINLERIHLLIDKLRSQVSDNSGAEHLLPTAQMLVAELQQIQQTERPRPSVSVVMPSGAGKFRQITVAPGADHFRELDQAENNGGDPSAEQVHNNFQLQPPITITEKAPEAVIDEATFVPATPVQMENKAIPSPEEYLLPLDQEDLPLIAKELETNQPTEPVPTALTEPSFPTSIPSDSPEIQQTAPEPVPEPKSKPEPTEINEIYAAAERQEPPRAAIPAPVIERINDENTAQELNYPAEDVKEKKRHLEFIHENFSAWSDYGIINEAPTLVQNRTLVTTEVSSEREHIDLNTLAGPVRFQDLNDHLKEDHEEWAQKMQTTPIDNLSNAIGINDRYLFISELFRGDESMYERTILTLNKFNSYDQAHAWAERELRLKLGWDMNNGITQQFEQLVKRRFLQKA